MQMEKGSNQPNKKLAAICGLFCPACGIYLAQRESLEEREKIAAILKIPVETLKCDGCRAAKRFAYCETCKMAACAAGKDLDFCAECKEYPCTALKEFQAAYPHRIELWQTQARIKEVGYEKWFTEMVEHYTCSRCGTMNSAYHLSCRACGAAPSCSYVELHNTEIGAFLSNRPGSPDE
jgi:hypothetical protein